jgi:small subunit ribosomal protein S20
MDDRLTLSRHVIIGVAIPGGLPPQSFVAGRRPRACRVRVFHMANTKSAKKATRKIERRTAVNKGRRSRMRSSLRHVETAISSGDKAAAQAALVAAEPALMRAARAGIIHKKSASRKVSRLTHRIVKLGS